jgi:hypothetical protein
MTSGNKLEHQRGLKSLRLINIVRIFVKVSVTQEERLSKLFSVSVFIMSHEINDNGDCGGAKIAPPLRKTLISLKINL